MEEEVDGEEESMAEGEDEEEEEEEIYDEEMEDQMYSGQLGYDHHSLAVRRVRVV